MDLHEHEIVAENYDLYIGKQRSETARAQFVAFHRELADEYGQQGVLDIACGTGNIAIPLAMVGHEVWGFDLSDAMIRKLQRKMDELNEEIRRNIHPSVQDMIDFSYDRQFSLAMIPASGFVHLRTPDEQRKALINIHSHLVSGRILTFNTFDPDLKRIADHSGGKREERMSTEFLSTNGNQV